MSQSIQNINDLEKDQDIPPPDRIKMFNAKDLYSNRPPPSIGNKHATISNNSNNSNDGLKTLGNITSFKNQLISKINY